jgi:serine/threonine-protein kinase
VSDKPKDTIIGQQPTAGEQLESGQAVSVTISIGRERTVAPNLLGLVSIEDARTALTDARLKLGSVQQEDSEQPPGYVLGQEYAEGTPLEVGTRVGITVSSGKIQVPQVVGSTEAQARSDLANKALVVDVIYEESKGTPGIVLKQVPTSGTPVVKGTLVTLTVSKPKESPTPSPSPTEPTPSPSPTEPSPTPEPTVSQALARP